MPFLEASEKSTCQFKSQKLEFGILTIKKVDIRATTPNCT